MSKFQSDFPVNLEKEMSAVRFATVLAITILFCVVGCTLLLFYKQYVLASILGTISLVTGASIASLTARASVAKWFSAKFFDWNEFEQSVLCSWEVNDFSKYMDKTSFARFMKWIDSDPLRRLRFQRKICVSVTTGSMLLGIASSSLILASQWGASKPDSFTITPGPAALELGIFDDLEEDTKSPEEEETRPVLPQETARPLPHYLAPPNNGIENPICIFPIEPAFPRETPLPKMPKGRIPRFVEGARRLYEGIAKLGAIANGFADGVVTPDHLTELDDLLTTFEENPIVTGAASADEILNAINVIKNSLKSLKNAIDSGDEKEITESIGELVQAIMDLVAKLMSLWNSVNAAINDIFPSSDMNAGQSGSSGSASGSQGGFSRITQGGLQQFVTGAGTPGADAAFSQRLGHEDSQISVYVDKPPTDNDAQKCDKPGSGGGPSGPDGNIKIPVNTDPRKGKTEADASSNIGSESSPISPIQL